MTRLSTSALVFVAFPVLVVGCSATEAKTPRSSDSCRDEGESCSCDDDDESYGEIVCTDGESECACDSFDDDGDSSDFSDDDDTQSTSKPRADSGTTRDGGPKGSGDAGVGSRTDSGISRLDGGRADASVPPDEDPPVTGDGPTPVIPQVNGTCPQFRTGVATIGGLSGISLQVGAKKNGTGSLIFYWHGTGSSSAEATFMLPAAVRNEVLAEGGIIVSPQGSTRRGGDCSGTATFSQGDFEVADLIVACAVREHGIDPRRIYTTGCSAGGLQAGCMASRRSSYIAAAVPNSGGIVFPQPIQDSKHIPALMTMHGSAADTVIVTFSRTSKTLGDQFKGAGGYVLNCNHGGGHCGAPGALQTAGWKFMKDHPFGVSPEPYAGGLPSGFPSYCKPL